MPINIFTVQNDLEENGWLLLSTEYKNLKSPLKMKCPEGHEVELTYEDWRKHKTCEVCLAGDPYRMKSKKIPPKKDDVIRTLALDASTNITGYSIYDGKELVSYGTFRAKADAETTERINQVKYWLDYMIKKIEPDIIGVETIQLQSYNGDPSRLQVTTYNTLSRLQGIILDVLFENKKTCGTVYPSEWRKFCGVGGRVRAEQKKSAQAKVKMWYDIGCSDDEADAICIGKYFVTGMQKNDKRNNYWGDEL